VTISLRINEIRWMFQKAAEAGIVEVPHEPNISAAGIHLLKAKSSLSTALFLLDIQG